MEDDLIFGDSFKQLKPSRIPFGCTTRYSKYILDIYYLIINLSYKINLKVSKI